MSMHEAGGRSPDLRVSDAERQRTVDLLRAHTGEGRLDLDEFSERVAAAYAARTRAELDVITGDLPVPVGPPVDQRLPTRRPRVTRVLAIMGGNRRVGRWRPGRRLRAVSVMGGSKLDLREAELEGDELSIFAIAVMGGVHIIVPEGMHVEMSGLPLMGGIHCKVPDPVGISVGPRLRVRAIAVMGGVDVVARPPRSHGKLGAGSGADDRHGSGHRLERRSHDHRRRSRSNRVDGPTSETGWWDDDRSGNGSSPDLAGAGTVTVLFTDVVGFTELTQRVGDEQARELLRRHAAVVRAEVARYGGREVKATGDGFLVVFASARQAVRCAAAIQRTLGRVDGALPVRIGLNSGDALHEGGDVIGFTVNVAARIADAAGAGEILVSAVTRELAGAVADVHFGNERSLELQGVTGVCHVHPVDWLDARA